MIQEAICNFLIFGLEDKSLIDLKNFQERVHLKKWLRIINPLYFSTEIVADLTWEKAVELTDCFVIQNGVKETLHLDIQGLFRQEEKALFSAFLQILIIHKVFNDVSFDKIVDNLPQQQKECLNQHLNQFVIEFQEQIDFYFKQSKQTQKDKNEILKILVETEKKLAQSYEKNQLLKASLEDRQKIKNIYEQKLVQKEKLIKELENIKNINLEQIEEQNQLLKKQNSEINQLELKIRKLKKENEDLKDSQSKIFSDMSDMKEKIDAYEKQFKENRKKILENNDLHFQISKTEKKLSNYKDLQEINHNQKYQISVLQTKNQEYLKNIEDLNQKLKKKSKTIEFFKQLQQEFEKRNQINLTKILSLEKDNKRFKAFNKNLIHKKYIEDKNKYQIPDQDTKIFRQSWASDINIQESLAKNYRNELEKRDQEIKRLQKLVEESQISLK